IRANTISFTVFPEIVPSIGNSFINTMKNINHTRSSISDDIRNILCSSANMRRAIPLILRLRSEERFSRNAETDLVCRLLLEKKKNNNDKVSCAVLTKPSEIKSERRTQPTHTTYGGTRLYHNKIPA